MLKTTRAYTLEKLAESGEVGEIARRHATHHDASAHRTEVAAGHATCRDGSHLLGRSPALPIASPHRGRVLPLMGAASSRRNRRPALPSWPGKMHQCRRKKHLLGVTLVTSALREQGINRPERTQQAMEALGFAAAIRRQA
jgi:hypothetical protein